MSNLPRTYIISLPEASERRERVSRLCQDNGLNFTIIDAVDGRNFNMLDHPNYNRKKRLRFFGRDLKGAELGCALSHKSIYQEMIQKNIDEAIIFEDDIILHDGFIDTISVLQNIELNYDMVRFMGRKKVLQAKQRKVKSLDNGVSLTRLCATPGGTYAYVIKQSGVKKLLKHLDKVTYPIDALVGRSWETGLNWFSVNKRLAQVDEDLGSFIGEARFDKTLEIKGLDKMLYPLCRLWFRITEDIGKKYWYFKTYFSDRKHANEQ
ncbi:MAG: glycosyltransferase family 25 protein [Pseudomonadota bacterium]